MTPTAKPRVLIIDNETKFLDGCKELLASHGFAATPCADSAQAVPLLKAEAFDVVLLDIRMPGLEGTDLLPLIKKLRPDLPVILVSAYCDEANAGYYRQLGAFEMVAKPFSAEVLLEAIGRAIHQEERIPLVLTSLSLEEGRTQVYRKLILSALTQTHWNQVKAAARLGVSRHSLIRWMKKLGISA